MHKCVLEIVYVFVFFVVFPTRFVIMTDVPDLVRVAVVQRLGSSDHSSLSIAILMA